MNRILKRIASASVVAVLLVAGFVSLVKAYAAQHGSGEYELGISVDSNADWVAGITVDSAEWNSDDTYLSEDESYFITAELHVPNDKVRSTTSIRAGGDSGSYTISQAGADEDWGGTHRKFTYTISYTAKSQHDHLSLNPYSEDNGGQPGPEPEQQGDTTANITVSAGAGTYQMTRRNPETGEEFVEDVEYDDRIDFRINGSQWNPGSSTISYNSDGNNDTVVFTFESLWIDRYYEDIVINNHTYTLADYDVDYDDKSWWLAHNNATQLVSFSIIGVPKSETYNIVAKHGENNGERFIGNFLWTADPDQAWKIVRDEEGRLVKDEDDNYVYELDENGEKIPNDDDYIGHSSINLVAVSYDLDNHTYTCDLDTDLCTDESHNEDEGAMSCVISEDEACAKNIMPYVSFESDESVEYDDGSLVVPSGAHVTMEIIPDYGYQIMNVNMSDLAVSENGVGRFTFKVPAGAAYFKADVIEMEDTVNTSTDLVASGEISLGEDQTTLDHGTAQLNVSDVELEEGDIAEFKDAAEGYNIKNYLEISLYNITCKGAEVCTGTDEDAWVDQIRDLNEPATITLQLEEGVDGNEIVIIHQKHDGTYEVIPTAYDPETRTITFTTTSFSNYAIASRTVESPDTGVFTGDNGINEADKVLVIIMAAIVAAGAVVFIVEKQIKRKE